MTWTEEKVQELFSPRDFTRGKMCCQRGQVTDLQISGASEREHVTCVVHGSSDHNVTLDFQSKGINVRCDCSQFYEKGRCKHLVAAFLSYIDANNLGLPLSSDSQARALLHSYMERSRSGQLRDEQAHLVPRICSEEEDYPSFSFQVGFERLYVVRDVKKFLDNVVQRESYSYGKSLTLCHALEQFDPHSQALIQIMLDQYNSFRSVNRQQYFDYFEYPDAVWGGSRERGQMVLTGDAFDRWFELLEGQSVQDSTRKGAAVAFQRGAPKVTIKLARGPRSAKLSVHTEGEWRFFGSTRSMYALGEEALLRCDDAFRENVWPLLRQRTGQRPMQVAFSDLPVFCGVILPRIEEMVEVEDPDGLLQEYLPDECVPCFYFDMHEDVLTMRLAFRYGDKQFDAGGKPPKNVKRNVLTENEAVALCEGCMDRDGKSEFVLTGEDAVFTFLTGSLERFHRMGEVYTTDRLRARRVQPTAAGVGVSMASGLLTLDVDTGGFPPEELEALYQSLLKKRRYHRLKDGRYLALDGSACETLAELSHMLQLSPRQLEQGKVTMPAFRALYVDDLLSEGKGDLKVVRDRQFRGMIRNFKSVSEADYAVPETLDEVLRPYQKVGFQWLKTLESCGFGGILADEMGLGKTVQVIAYLTTADRRTTGLTSLIVCPASLILNWQDEFNKFAPGLSVALIMGAAAERKRLIVESGECDVWVTSYELLRQDVEQYQDLQFYCCVLDEAQHIKNQSTLASKAVKAVDCRQRFVLTGTPVENRLSELWNLFDFLMPGYLFSHRAFVEKLEKPVVKSGDEEAAARLRRLVQPFMLRRLKRNVLKELPPKSEFVRKIQLSEEERRVYHASALAAREGLEAEGKGKLAILAALTQLRQICCAPQLCFENYQGPDSKLDAALELCAGMVENGHQILLFSQFTTMLDLIRARLDEQKISNFTLQGSTSKEKRAQLVKAFNAGEASVFLISLKAGGTGLNLTAADVVIHYDPWWNQAAQNQATDRAHRIGQQAHVQVYKLIAKGTIEERILELQSQKAALMDAISEGTETGIMDMSKEDLLALLN